jgi:hypothetical protein
MHPLKEPLECLLHWLKLRHVAAWSLDTIPYAGFIIPVAAATDRAGVTTFLKRFVARFQILLAPHCNCQKNAAKLLGGT